MRDLQEVQIKTLLVFSVGLIVLGAAVIVWSLVNVRENLDEFLVGGATLFVVGGLLYVALLRAKRSLDTALGTKKRYDVFLAGNENPPNPPAQ